MASPHHHLVPAAPTEGLPAGQLFSTQDLLRVLGRSSDNFGFKSRLQQVLAL